MKTLSDIIKALVNKESIIIDERITISDIFRLLDTIDTEIRGLTGGEDSDSLGSKGYFPPTFFENVDIGLDYFEFTPGDDGIGRRIQFTLSWDNANWTIIPDVFTIEGFSVRVDVLDSLFNGELKGLVELEGYEFIADIQLPDLVMRASLNTPPDNRPSPLALLQRFSTLPSNQLTSLPTDTQLSSFEILANPGAKRFFLHFEIDQLPLGSHISLDTQIQLGYTHGIIDAAFWANFLIDIDGKPDLDILITAVTNDPKVGWQLEGGLATRNLTLDDFTNWISKKFLKDAAVDTGFAGNIGLDYLYLAYDTANEQFTFSIEFSINREKSDKAESGPFDAKLNIDFELNKTDANSYGLTLGGEMTLGEGDQERIFDLIFHREKKLNKTQNSLLALYRKPDGEHVTIKEILAPLITDKSILDATEQLSFSLKNAMLVLEFDKSSNGSTSKYLLGVEVDFGIDLSGLGKLPIIGQQFAGQGALKLGFQPLLTSFAPTDDLSKIKNLLPPGSPTIPDNLNPGFSLATTITFGEFSKVINLGMSPADRQIASGQEDGNHVPAAATADESKTPSEETPRQSADVNQSFGALSISRLNLGYESGTIKMGIDGQLRLGPLEVALFGLGAAYDIKESHFKASLDGLVLNFNKPPLSITGGFFRFDRGEATPPDYVGELNLQMEEFGLLVLGAFSQMADGHPSMFLYVFVDVPLGGPVFFFVEGLALGFGYNRKLDVPPIDQLYKFPLVADAIGSSPQVPAATGAGTQAEQAELLRQKFEMLATYIYPEEGQYFLAVGLKFNSFKILNCFALLTVGFGHSFDIGIMGIGRVTTPPEAPVATANIEMAFSIRYQPAEGFIGANGILTPNTYVYSPLVRLEGGFAFYAWMKGKHEGDFVVSIGGYHPAFKVPTHYPSKAAVPRVSLGWVLNDNITIKGEAYFATTPHAMMAGGALVALFDSDPPPSHQTQQVDKKDKKRPKKHTITVKASFTAGVDFLIYWEPFHYEADAYVEIYAKASLHTKVGTYSKSLSARADVNIWGPEFAGTARIKAKVFGFKVHFHLDFGANPKQQPQKVDWPTFAKKFLPANYEETSLSLVIQQGLVKTIKASDRVDGGSGDLWVINPKELKLGVSSNIPLTQKDAIYANPVAGDKPLTDFNGQILRQKPAPINHTLSISCKDSEGEEISPFIFIDVNKNYPVSLWTKDGEYAPAKPGLNEDQVISALSGHIIMPKNPPKALQSHSFHVSNLNYEEPSGSLPLNLFPASRFTFTPVADVPDPPVDPLDPLTVINRNKLLAGMGMNPLKETQLKSGLFDNFSTRPELMAFTPKV